jgi:prevent-host-death family protein
MGIDTTRAVSSTQARDQFGELFDRAAHGKERIAVTKRAKPRVAIVPIEDVQLLEFLENLVDLEAYRVALAEVQAGARPIPLDESARSLGFDPDELRRAAQGRAATRRASP